MAGRRPDATLAYHRAELVGQRLDEIADVSLLERAPELRIDSRRAAVLYVFSDRRAEQDRILRNDANRVSERLERHRRDVGAVDQNPSRAQLIEARNQTGQRS